MLKPKPWRRVGMIIVNINVQRVRSFRGFPRVLSIRFLAELLYLRSMCEHVGRVFF